MNSPLRHLLCLMFLLAASGTLLAQSLQNLPTIPAAPVGYTVTITNSGSVCAQTVSPTAPNPIPNWVSLSQQNGDYVANWVGASSTPITIGFPIGSAAFPGTPFWDDPFGNWLRSFQTGTASPPTTLTSQESAGTPIRFQYSSVTFNDGSHCSFPVGGMGVQVTK